MGYEGLNEIHKQIGEIKNREKNIKIVVWNTQSWNKVDKEKVFIKQSFILEKIQFVHPEIVYLIDINNDVLSIGSGYKRFYDGRNLLFVNEDIVEFPEIKENCFIFKNMKLICMYWVPGVLSYDICNVIQMMDKSWIVVGDFNLKSNKKFKFYFKKVLKLWRNGENSYQLGFLGSAVNNFKSYEAPSDHKLITGMFERIVRSKSCLRVKAIKENYALDIIDGVLNNKKNINFSPKIVIKKTNKKIVRENYIIDYVLNNYINNHVEWLYAKYNARWKVNKREPFLGKYIPDIIVEDYKNLMCHNENKDYVKPNFNFNENDMFSFNYNNWSYLFKDKKEGGLKLKDLNIAKTKSIAINYEFFNLKTITDDLSFLFNLYWDKKEFFKVKNALKNICEFAYTNRENLCASCFFLMKDPKLESVKHVRMIMIVPIVVKLFEAITMNEIYEFFNNYFWKKYGLNEYQFGALKNHSTFMALGRSIEKFREYKADGFLSLDISQGYESVNLELLEECINEYIFDDRIKFVLLNWICLIKNMDIVINNIKIKRTKGIPMGLSFAPVMFIFYLDCALDSNLIIKDFITAYVDDLNILVFKKDDPRNESETMLRVLVNRFNKFGLKFNQKKMELVTSNIESLKFVNDLFPNIKYGNISKFLGRAIEVRNDTIYGNDDWINEVNKDCKPISNWNTLEMKSLIYNGGIDAKNRYAAFMFEFRDINTKKILLNKAWKFYKNSFKKTSYLMIALLLGNYARFFIGLSTVKQWLKEDCDLENKKQKISDESLYERFEYVVHCLNVGIPQLDLVWNTRCGYIDKKLLKTKTSLVFPWMVWKDFCDRIWNFYKKSIFKGWYIEKIKIKDEDKIWNIIDKEDYWLVLSAKFTKKFGFLLDFLLGHLDEKDEEWINVIKCVFTYISNEKKRNGNCFKGWKLDDMAIDFHFIFCENFNFVIKEVVDLLIDIEKYHNYNLLKLNTLDSMTRKRILGKKQYFKCWRQKIWHLFFVMDSMYRNKSYINLSLEALLWNINWLYHNLNGHLDELYDVSLFQEFKDDCEENNLEVYDVNEVDMKIFGLID